MRRPLVYALVTASLCAVLVISSCGGPPSAVSSTSAGVVSLPTVDVLADYPGYDTVAKLVAASDEIIVGQVVATDFRNIDVTLGDDEPLVLAYDVITVKVRQAVKGDLSEGDEVEVKQLVQGEEQGADLNRLGLRAMLFLETYPRGIPSSPLNPWQGVLPLKDGAAAPYVGNTLFAPGTPEAEVVGLVTDLVK
jgi:hypothetical protein